MRIKVFLQRHHKAIWRTLVVLAAVGVTLWLLGLYVGVVGGGVHWRHG